MSKLSVIDINKKDRFGQTALFKAVLKNDISQVENLLSMGANVNLKDDRNTSLLHQVAYVSVDENYLNVVEILLKRGADPNAQDDNGRTPLHSFSTRSNVKVVQLFLNFGANLNLVDDLGRNFLFPAAVNYKNPDVVQLLLDHDLDVNHLDKDEKTPVHAACNHTNVDIIILKSLLKRGANMNSADSRGFTPLVTAMESIWQSREIAERNLKFIIKYTDFSVIHEGVHALSFHHKFRVYLWQIVLEHLAVLQSIKIPVHQDIMNAINSRDDYKDYYKRCQEELLRAKSTKLKNTWVSFYNILVDGKRQLKNYSGNEELIDDFKKSDCVRKFPIYGDVMADKVKKGFIRRKLYDRSSILLSMCLPKFNRNHLIVRDVLDCIVSKKDLYKFCR